MDEYEYEYEYDHENKNKNKLKKKDGIFVNTWIWWLSERAEGSMLKPQTVMLRQLFSEKEFRVRVGGFNVYLYYTHSICTSL